MFVCPETNKINIKKHENWCIFRNRFQRVPGGSWSTVKTVDLDGFFNACWKNKTFACLKKNVTRIQSTVMYAQTKDDPIKSLSTWKKTCKKLCIRIGFTFSWKSPNGFFQMAMCCQPPWMVGEVDCFSYAATSECCFDMFVTLRAETPKPGNTWIFQDDHIMSQPPKNTKSACRNNGERWVRYT